jgi:hypothetical protein
MARRVTGLALWNPTGKSLAVVQVARDLEPEWPLLVRRMLYLAYERGLYPDKKKGSCDAVGNVLGRARRAGLLTDPVLQSMNHDLLPPALVADMDSWHASRPGGWRPRYRHCVPVRRLAGVTTP